jgi:hypothetical protein
LTNPISASPELQRQNSSRDFSGGYHTGTPGFAGAGSTYVTSTTRPSAGLIRRARGPSTRKVSRPGGRSTSNEPKMPRLPASSRSAQAPPFGTRRLKASVIGSSTRAAALG